MNGFSPYGSAPQPLQTPHYAQLHPSFRHNRFLIRRKILTLLGAKMHVYDDAKNVVLFAKMKAFKLKEDFRIFADEAMTTPLLAIRARKILDIASPYDVYDVSTGGEYHIGVLKRKGLKSIIRDEWEVWNTQDQPIGLIQEEGSFLAILRRFVEILSILVPQKYNFSVNGQPVGFMKQNFNPFVMKLTAVFSQDRLGYFDRRLAAAAAVLLCIIEGKQK